MEGGRSLVLASAAARSPRGTRVRAGDTSWTRLTAHGPVQLLQSALSGCYIATWKRPMSRLSLVTMCRAKNSGTACMLSLQYASQPRQVQNRTIWLRMSRSSASRLSQIFGTRNGRTVPLTVSDRYSARRRRYLRSARGSASSGGGLYWSTMLTGIRPRSLTAMPCSLAHARMSPLRCRPAAVRAARRAGPRPTLRACSMNGAQLCAEGAGVRAAQVDLAVGAVEAEPHRLVGRAAVQVIFQCNGHFFLAISTSGPAMVRRTAAAIIQVSLY